MTMEDNTEYTESQVLQLNNIITKISDKNLGILKNIFIYPKTLEKAEDLEDKQIVIETTKNGYKTNNLVGFIGCNDEKLIIKSRFGDNLFEYLFKKVYDVPNIVNLEPGFSYNKIFEYLIFLFPQYLRNALKKGPFKQYVWHKYNDANVKGYIDIPRHIKNNVFFNGKIAYNTREFSYDNYLMQLIRHTIEYIKTKPYGKSILFDIKKEIKVIEECTSSYSFYNRKKTIIYNNKNKVRHAYYNEYIELQKICIMILTHKMMDFKGKNKIYGILFDCASLWEEYIFKVLQEKKDIFYHPNNRKKYLSQNLFIGYKKDDERRKGLIYPDFIGKYENDRIIADAKYKPADNINANDYKQMLSYMFRFDSVTGYFFYPGNDIEELKLLSGVTTDKEKSKPRDKNNEISIIKLGIKIPQQELSHLKFETQMKISEEEFVSTFNIT